MKQREKIALLRKTRKQMQVLNKKRDDLFTDLCIKLGLKYDGPDILYDYIFDILFDYIFNGFDGAVKVARKI